MLVTLFSTAKAHQESVRDLGASVDAIYQYLSDRDPQFAKKFERHEGEAQGEPSFRAGSDLSIKELDEAIRRLKDHEALTL